MTRSDSIPYGKGESIMLGKKRFIIGVLMLVPITATLILYLIFSHDISKGVEGPIKAAVESEDAGMALNEVRSVLKYVESEGLDVGDMRPWYIKLKKAEAKLAAASSANATKAGKDEALAYLKNNFMKDGKASTPNGMSMFPYQNYGFPAFLIFGLLGLLGLVFCFIGLFHWDFVEYLE